MKNIKLQLIIALLIAIGPAILVSCSSENTQTTKAENWEHEHSDSTQLWTCGMHPEVILEEPGQCPKCGMNLVPLKAPDNSEDKDMKDMDMSGDKNQTQKPKGKGKILYWQAPMNPTEIYDAPGKSKMGMDLIPVYENSKPSVSTGSAANSLVRIDPATAQNMGVRTAPVKRIDFSRNIRVVGKVDYNEKRIYVVSSKISGWIEKLRVNYTGKSVNKGQTLLEIYSPELVTTQKEYLLAIKNKEMLGNSTYPEIKNGAESLLNSARQRLLNWDIPKSEIGQLEKSGIIHKTLKLNSPARAVVIHKNVVEGAYVKEGMSLYEIADLSSIWVYASVYDNELPWIKNGQEAEMELSYAPGKILMGKISYIYPYLNEKARDVKVRIEFPNPDLLLKPGMYANVKIKTSAIKDALVIPTEAVIRSGERNLVFISTGEGRFQPRPVRIGEESDDGKVRIIAGLKEGENVVISAQFLLDSESKLQEAIGKMLEGKKLTAKGSKKDPKEMKEMGDDSGNEAKVVNSKKSSGKSEMKCGSGKCGGSN